MSLAPRPNIFSEGRKLVRTIDGKEENQLDAIITELPDHRPTTHWVHHITSCIAQSNAPDDGQNCCPKHVELIWIYQQTVIVASSWFSSLPSILTMRGQTNTKLVRTILKMPSNWRSSFLLIF
jgi:hypothetical protein